VISVTVSSGSWAGGDAAGTLYVCAPTGAFTEAGTISVGANSNVATLTADFAVSSWKTWTLGATAARIAPGDTIRIAKSSDEVNSGIQAAFTANGDTITLASALTKDICDCESAWTASANVTDSSAFGDYKTQGTYGRKFTIATAFTTGKIAYFDLGENKDFSAYQKISLFLRSSADKAAGIFQICLCSDAAGDTPVDSLTIDVPINYDGIDDRLGTYVTLDKGSALGSSIRSVAIYALSDPGAHSLYIDNIIACNDFSLNSLVGVAGDAYWPVTSITSDTTVKVGNQYEGVNSTYWHGTTGNHAFYYRNPVRATSFAAAATTTIESVTDSGSSGSLITYSGGWNPNSNERDGMTIYDGLSNGGRAVYLSGKTYIQLENLGWTRFYNGVYLDTYAHYTYLKNLIFAGIGGSSIYWKAEGSSHYNLSFNGDVTITATGGTNPIYFGPNTYTGGSDKGTHIKLLGCSGSFRIAGCSHAFNGEISYSGSAYLVGALDFSYAMNCYMSKFNVLYGDSLYLITAENGANNLIETIELFGNVSCFTYAFADVLCRVGCLITNGNTITKWHFAPVPGSLAHKTPNFSLSIDCIDQGDRWMRVNAQGFISDQITGGQNAAWAYGGEGTCLYLNPDGDYYDYSKRYPLAYVFYCPVSSGVTYQIHFQKKKTSSAANCTLEIDRISGCGITEIRDESVTLTDSWAEHTSASFTPTYSGYVRCELHARDGSTTGDIGIDDIHLHKVS
jgi:hypothetical protein